MTAGPGAGGMDLMLLRMFQKVVEEQCRYLLAAGTAINSALASKDPQNVWAEIHSLLAAAANISKLLWGGSATTAARREPLRESLDVDDSSPLRPRDMRNNLEHIDERLQTWWDTSQRRNLADQLIGPPGMIVGLDSGDFFRSYDPTSGHLSFGEQSVNLPELHHEVSRIYPRVLAESSKPHWVR